MSPKIVIETALVPLSRSPFTVDVGPEAGKQKVRAWGPGLSSGMVGKSSDFVVEAVGTDVGALGEHGLATRNPVGPSLLEMKTIHIRDAAMWTHDENAHLARRFPHQMGHRNV